MKPELQQLCESHGLRFFEADDVAREATFLGEAAGVKYSIEVPYDAIPRDIAVLLFIAGRDQMRKSISSKFEAFTHALKHG